jgi:hypothetical protein
MKGKRKLSKEKFFHAAAVHCLLYIFMFAWYTLTDMQISQKGKTLVEHSIFHFFRLFSDEVKFPERIFQGVGKP